MTQAPVFLQSTRGERVALQPGQPAVVKAQAGARYLLRRRDADAERHIEGVVVTRHGEDLHVKAPNGGEAVLEGFFSADAMMVLPGDHGEGVRLTAESAPGPMAGDGGELMYAWGPQELMAGLMHGQPAGLDGALGAASPSGAASGSFGALAGLGTLALGGLAMSHGSATPVVVGPGAGTPAATTPSTTTPSPSTGTNTGTGTGSDASTHTQQPVSPTVTPTVLQGNVVAGPVVAGHGLHVTAYGADGAVVGEAAVRDDGTFSLALPDGYSGALLLRVSDTTPGPDYIDEATGLPKDLGGDLRAAVVIPAAGGHAVNVNPVTELAVRQLGLAGGDGSSATSLAGVAPSRITATNAAVAQALGLGGQDLVLGAAPQALVDGSGAGVAGNDYGRLLAAISGAEAAGGVGTDAVLSALASQIANGVLGDAGLRLLMQGAVQVGGIGSALAQHVAALTSQASGVAIDRLAGDDTLSLAEAQQGLLVTGHCTDGAQVSVRVGGASHAASVSGGTWSVTIPASELAGLEQGAALLRVSATVNGSTQTAARALWVDTVPPAPPTLDLHLTREAAPVLTGTAEAGSVVDVSVGGARFTTTADASGHWRVDTGTAVPASGTFALGADGAHEVGVVSHDAAGNGSSLAASFRLDTGIATPTLSTQLTNHATPTLAGTAEAGSQVVVTVGSASFVTTADADGIWRIDTGLATPVAGSRQTLSDGTQTVTLAATDAAGNRATATAAFTVDTTPPPAPSLTLAHDTGENGSDGITHDATVQVHGLEPGAAWRYSLDAGQTWHAGSGESFALDHDGRYDAGQVRVRQTDAAGNTSETGASMVALELDTVAPGAPTGALTEDTGPDTGDGITRNPRIELAGLEPGARWQLSLDGGQAWSDAGTGDGLLLPDGGYADGQVQVRQVDAAGNAGEPFRFGALTVDSTTAVPTLELHLTNSDTPVLSGTAEAGSTVTVTVGGATFVTTTAPDGHWHVDTATATPLDEGSFDLQGAGDKTVVLHSTDALGNTASAEVQFTVDHTPPAAPTLALLQDNGFRDDDGLSNVGTVVVGGLEPGAAWQYSVDGGTSWLNGSGDGFTLPPGSYPDGSVRVRQTDAAGNLSEEDGSFGMDVVIDTAIPAGPTLVLPEDTGVSGSDGVTRAHTVSVGDLEPDAAWTYSLDGGESWAEGVDASFELPAGVYAAGQVQVQQIDASGNPGLVTFNATPFVVNDSDVDQLDLSLLGSGGPALLSGSGLVVDVSALTQLSHLPGAGSLAPITQLDLGSDGSNMVSLTAQDVLTLGGLNTFVQDGTRQMLVTGQASDQLAVDLADGPGTQDWTHAAQTEINGTVYETWTHDATHATLYVAPGVIVG